MNRFLSFLRRRRPIGNESPETKYFRLVVWSFVAIVFVAGVAGLSAFVLSLRGAEETMVPDLAGTDLVDALLSLQERGLYPEVQLRFYSDPALKGHVIDQKPEPGTLVRAGRRIALVVSQGAIIDRVADYRGRTLGDVQGELQTMFPTSEKLLQVGPVSYIFDESAVGTILEQDPAPDAQITGAMELKFVVSRGPEVATFSLPSFVGLSWEDAIVILARDDVPFRFKLEEQPTIGQDGVVVAQSPEPGTEVVVGAPIDLSIRSLRDVPSGSVFGMFDRTLPEYAVPVELRVEVVSPEGESSTMFKMIHPGGRVVFPYLLEVGSNIVLYRYDVEVIRIQVRDDEE